MTPHGFASSTPQEVAVVLQLVTFRFLTVAQIADLVFETSAASARSRVVMAGRLLAASRRRGLVAATPRLSGGLGGGSSRPTYYLTPRGYRLAHDLNPALPVKRLKSPGRYLIHHALITAEVALAFRRAALRHDDHEVVAWECEWQAVLGTGNFVVVPDGYLVYRVGAQRLHAWIEVDLGTEHSAFFARKISRYLDLHRSGAWRARLRVWPLVLVVTETEPRAAQLRRITEAVLASQLDRRYIVDAAPFAFASLADVVSATGPFGVIWHHAGAPSRTSLLPPERLLSGPDAASTASRSATDVSS